MALSADLRGVLTLVWNVEKPRPREFVRSSVFTLMDADWNLELRHFQDPEGGYNFSLQLVQEAKKKNWEKPFRVTTFVENRKSNDFFLPGASAIVNTTSQFIWFTSSSLKAFDNCDHLHVSCTFHDITLSKDLIKNETTTLPADLESLSNDFSKLLEVETFSDASVRCGDLTVPVHRNVLSARSEVFAAMFRNKMAESETGSVDVRDMDPQVLRLLLRYIYTGKVADVTDDAVPSLYVAGDRYAVHSLKKACSDRMVKCLTEENCVSVLALADAHSDAAFKQEVISFICGHEGVLAGEVWQTFSEEHPSLAVEVYKNFVRPRIQKT